MELQDIPVIFIRKYITWAKACKGLDGPVDYMALGVKIVSAANLSGPKADKVYKVVGELQSKLNPPKIPEDLPSRIKTFWNFVHGSEFKAISHDFYSAWIQIVDTDNDGVISRDEYKIIWKAMGLDTRFSDIQFDYMDTDKDNVISFEEYHKAGMEYWTCYDANNLNRFYGPLINY